MCASDDTLEPSTLGLNELPSGRKVHIINGSDVTHQCRDSRRVRAAVLESQDRPIELKRKLVAGDTVRRALDLT
jgi:hypothetical protein